MPLIRRTARYVLADQRGQDTVEYLGVLMIVAAIVAVAAVALRTFGPTIAHDTECLIAKVFHLGGCTSPSGPPYPVSASTKTVGYGGRAVVFNGSHSYTVQETNLSNGTSTITVTNTGTAGVSAQWGANVELGSLGGAGADASVGGGISGGQSYTWTFPTWKAGQHAYQSISQGSALGLAGHDAVNSSVGWFPVLGPLATKGFDAVTGASGAPGEGSLPHKNLTSSATGGGVQGSADAGAHVDFGPLQAGVNASLDANAGLYHINYGSEKGDWDLTAGLDGSADGDLANYLFGAQADGVGTVNGDVSVLFSPSGAPEKLEVTASGDGVWELAPPSSGSVDVPGESSGESGGSKESGGEKEPLFSLDTENTGGSGEGSVFSGTLDLSNDPQAAQDVTSILEGDPSRLGDLIDQMNSNGTETLQSYQITRSNSTVAAGMSFGAGAGGNLSNGSSHATYNPPKTREDGGKWHTGS